MVTEDFVVSGTCTEQMYGMCESLWEPNMVSWWHGAGLGSQVPTSWPSGENVFTWQVMGRMVQVGKKATAAEPWKGIQKLHLPGPWLPGRAPPMKRPQSDICYNNKYFPTLGLQGSHIHSLNTHLTRYRVRGTSGEWAVESGCLGWKPRSTYHLISYVQGKSLYFSVPPLP